MERFCREWVATMMTFLKRIFQPAKFAPESGQTIIEVLIATLVVGMVLTAVAATLTVSVKNTAQSRYQEVGRARAQSGLEVFRRERNNLGWQEFVNVLSNGTYCLNALPADSTEFEAMSTGACPSGVAVIGTDFVREATVEILSADDVRVEVSVMWQDGALDKEVKLTQIFQRYENEQ